MCLLRLQCTSMHQRMDDPGICNSKVQLKRASSDNRNLNVRLSTLEKLENSIRSIQLKVQIPEAVQTPFPDRGLIETRPTRDATEVHNSTLPAPSPLPFPQLHPRYLRGIQDILIIIYL